jgi:hypothetical protein
MRPADTAPYIAADFVLVVAAILHSDALVNAPGRADVLSARSSNAGSAPARPARADGAADVPSWRNRPSTVGLPWDMRITDVLAVIEHDIRGVAATVGTLATLLADGRLPQAEQKNAFQRLQRAAARLEALSADAQALADWTITDSAPERQWRHESLSALVEGTVGESDDAKVIVESGSEEAWRNTRVRITADSAFEDAVRSIYSVATREQGAAVSCQVRLVSLWCEVFFGPASVKGWDDPRVRVPVEVMSGGLKPFVALAVFAGHGVAVWRFPGGDGIGLSIPVAQPESRT